MPPTKRNKKGNRRGNPAARAAQQRPRPDLGPPAPTVPPSGSPAIPPSGPSGPSGPSVPPGAPAGLAVPPGLASTKKPSPGLAPGQDLSAGLTSANNGPARGAARLIPPVTASAASARLRAGSMSSVTTALIRGLSLSISAR